MINFQTVALRDKCPNTKLFLVRIFLFSDWNLQIRKSPYSVRIQENTDQKQLRIWTLSGSVWSFEGLLIDNFLKPLLTPTSYFHYKKSFRQFDPVTLSKRFAILSNSRIQIFLSFSQLRRHQFDNNKIFFIAYQEKERQWLDFFMGHFQQK